jgi:hypothetical protein
MWRSQYLFAIPMLSWLALQPAGSAVERLSISQRPGSDLISISVPGTGHHTLQIDDAVSFRDPVVTRMFAGSHFELHQNEAALIPGVPYQVRLDRNPQAYSLRLSGDFAVSQELSCSTLRATWQTTGRFLTGQAYSQLKWDETGHRWVPVLPAVPIGESLYNVELILRPAISAARACHDLQVMDEIALYYTAMLDKAEPISGFLKRQNLLAETRDRMSTSDPHARTFAARFGPSQIGEGELYNSQWLHPAALLLRLISQLPDQERTPGMRTFAAQFTRFIVKEQLLRFLFDQQMPPLGGSPHRGRVAHWELAMQGLKGQVHWDTAMSDIDLWLLTSSAELLGAQANDPQLIVIEASDLAKLRQAIEVGVRFFQSKRTVYPDTVNFRGEKVGSASYFNGDYDGLPEMRGTAVTGEKYPGDNAPARPGASWDLAHMYRVAIFVRTLYENKKATGVKFPEFADLQLLVNQYLYKVFNGDFDRPLLRNNFDGSDGWFRVGYNGEGVGQPPSAYCNMRDVRRLCMTPGSIIGWPELRFVNPDLSHLEQTFIKLGFDENPTTRTFIDRYYFWLAPFGLTMSEDKKVYGGAFYAIAAENADSISPN